MRFEVGKTYQHKNGKRMTIMEHLKTRMYGECFIGKFDSGELVLVEESEEDFLNWHERECPYKAEAMTRGERGLAIEVLLDPRSGDDSDIKWTVAFAVRALQQLNKIEEIVDEWQSDTRTDNLSYECMAKIAALVKSQESEVTE